MRCGLVAESRCGRNVVGYSGFTARVVAGQKAITIKVARTRFEWAPDMASSEDLLFQCETERKSE